MDEQISAWLIAYPYLAGCMAGWSSSRKISLGILAIGAMFIIPGTQSLIGDLGSGERSSGVFGGLLLPGFSVV